MSYIKKIAFLKISICSMQNDRPPPPWYTYDDTLAARFFLTKRS